MRLTQILHGPPVFRFWKEFGAGKDLKKRLGYFNQWQYIWNAYVRRMKIPDKTLPIEKLPPGARVMDAKDFLAGHIDAMPEDLMRIASGQRILYNHPWPYNIEVNAKKDEPIHYYTIDSRFYKPKEDIENLTHTIIETESIEPCPAIEPQAEHIDQVQRRIDWAISGDSVLVRLPKRRVWPKINLKPIASYGLTVERSETNVLKSIAQYSQSVLASSSFGDEHLFNKYLNLSTLSYPQCRLLIERDSRKLGLNLCIDHMTVGREPLSIINNDPGKTEAQDITDISPRTWRSLLERTTTHPEDWSFKFPKGLFPRTIYLASRIKRDQSDEEMMAKNIIHAFGLTNQLARSHQHQLPLTMQVISYKLLPKKTFFFSRYQLNTLDFGGVKNQAWHSGPIEDVSIAFRYFLDFEKFHTFEKEARKNVASSNQ